MKQRLHEAAHLLVSDCVKASSLNLLAVTVEAHVTQHHDGAQQQSRGVGHIFSRYIRSRSVNLMSRHEKVRPRSESRWTMRTLDLSG